MEEVIEEPTGKVGRIETSWGETPFLVASGKEPTSHFSVHEEGNGVEKLERLESRVAENIADSGSDSDSAQAGAGDAG